MKIPAWTFSQLDTYESCPRKYYHLRVAKDVVEPPSIHTEWGSKVHEALEFRLKDGTPLPEPMKQWEGIVSKIEKLPGVKHPEFKFALDENFQPTEWGTAWTRGIADVSVVSNSKGMVLDYKTGKRKLTSQLNLYAAYMFAYYPELTSVDTGFVWLKDMSIDKNTVQREDAPAIWQSFIPKYNRLQESYERNSWMPRPSGLCKAWCHVMTCEFNGRRGT